MAKEVICVLLASLFALCRSAPVAFHGGSDAHCPLTVKILDAVKGTPAGNIALDLFRQDQGGTWEKIASGWCLKLMQRDIVITHWLSF
nr:transthyretin isoform X1 [Danio rerio]|eukprot:XP_009292827.1 transthyretin isoform X1 [Danio rerio]